MLTQHTFHIHCIGKNKDAFVSSGISHFETQIKKYCRIEFSYIKESSHTAIPKKIMEDSLSLVKSLSGINNPFIISLCEGPCVKNSVEGAKLLQQWMNQSLHPVFIIGGAFGLSEDLKKQSRSRLSLSPLTFNHQLVRLILAEQLFRWLNILYGGDYHH